MRCCDGMRARGSSCAIGISCPPVRSAANRFCSSERSRPFATKPGTRPHRARPAGLRSGGLAALAAGSARRCAATSRRWLRHDIVAGLVLTTMLVPVGIAYAVASGVPGIYGLYATIVPLLAYALFGPSRILVLGPDSSLAAVILAVVLPLSGGDPMRAIALAGMMAIVSGTVCILAGLARLGFITELLSKPIRYGYMNGIALTVLISQLPKLFGFSIESDGPLKSLLAIATARARRPSQPDCVPGRRGYAGGDPAAEGQPARAGHPGRRGWSNHRRGCAGPGGPRGRVGARLAPARPAGLRHPMDHLRRYRPRPDRRARRRPGVVRRHQRVVALLCGADADLCGSQPGDGRSRCRQPGRRILSGLSHQQQFVAHARG